MAKRFIFKQYNSRVTVFEHDTGAISLITKTFSKQNLGKRNREKININLMGFSRDEARFILLSLTGLELSQ